MEQRPGEGLGYFAIMSSCSQESTISTPEPWMRLSVVLPPCLCDKFNALRIAIVHKDEGLRPIISDGQSLQRRASIASNRVDLCTLVFELAKPPPSSLGPNRGIHQGEHQLFLLQCQRYVPSEKNPPHPKVAYERTFPINKMIPKISLRIRAFTDGYFTEHREGQVYDVFIKPIGKTSMTPPKDLPRDFLRSSVRLSLSIFNRPNWEQSLLSYALVNKSWLHLLELFWELAFPSTPAAALFYVRNLRGVISSMKCDPAHANRIRSLSGQFFDATSPDYLNFMEFILAQPENCLQHVSVEHVVFSPTKTLLAALRKVEHFQVYQSQPQETTLLSDTLADLQKVIKYWEWLRILTVSAQLLCGDSDIAITGPPVAYLLEHLDLRNVLCFGGQLLHFFSNPLPQRLRTLKLMSVKGLSNSALSDLFSSVASTIEAIRIENCDIEALEKGEEYALDVSLSQMVAVKDVDVDTNVASLSSITRLPPKDSVKRSLAFRIVDTGHFFASGISESLPAAFEETNWSRIGFSVAWPGRLLPEHRRMIETARGTAASKGVLLNVYSG